MSRLITVQIEGEEFPLFFSVLAMEKIYDKFGNMQSMMESITSEENHARQFSKILDVLCIENYAGVKYLERQGEKGKLIDKDLLLETLNPFEVNSAEYWTKALECINAAQARTVETQADPKNAEATPEKTL